MYRHEEPNPNEPSKEGPLSFVLFESPFASVSKVSRGHPFGYPRGIKMKNRSKLKKSLHRKILKFTVNIFVLFYTRS
jgi:hypothetical protein